MTEGALVGRRRVLLVRPRSHDRGVDVQGRVVAHRTGARVPSRSPCPGSGARHPPQLAGPEGLEGPLRGGSWRDRPEQRRLAAQHL